MSGVAGYGASIKKSGTSTGFTDEDMSNTAGNTFQIDDTAKQVFDRDATLTFYEDDVEIDASDVSSIDYLYGKVTFATGKTGAITVDGNYMPMSNVAGAREVTLNRTAQLLDDTDLGNAGYHTKEYGLQDVAVTVGRFDDIQYAFTDIIENRTACVIEIAPNATKSYRGWFKVESSGLTLDINALLDESIGFTLDGDTTTGKTFSRSDA
tara:strand:+ start:775 stop:1401 length:627 start_codon:yes stop_codon:yes gene_type:complete